MLELLSIISISFVILVLLILWALWILYVAMMNVKRVSETEKLPWQAKILLYPTIVVFDIVEFIANVFVCTIIFWDWPKEITVSDRLRRYKISHEKYSWRVRLVNFIKPMLDPFDPAGPHI